MSPINGWHELNGDFEPPRVDENRKDDEEDSSSGDEAETSGDEVEVKTEPQEDAGVTSDLV
ncbi:hypothetical protein TWF481_004569 [Arthrobotrys musiformis]|uniref:Uncharacterized protein n=1 Tax=Arthrobotrys musiformis TaxID=47236 RepID=A0AAV9WKC2_9PEZI